MVKKSYPEVLKFISQALNETFIMYKVAFGVFSGCRRKELVKILITHVLNRPSVLITNVLESGDQN